MHTYVPTWRYPCEYESAAEQFLHSIGEPECPSDAFELAWAANVRVHYGSPARTDGERIYLPRRLRGPERHWCVAHELAHVLIGRYRMRQAEEGADRLAAALMLPLPVATIDFLGGSDASALLERHRNCSVELIAARLAEVASILRPGVARARSPSRGHAAAFALAL